MPPPRQILPFIPPKQEQKTEKPSMMVTPSLQSQLIMHLQLMCEHIDTNEHE
jgi:hypothetical protein